MISKETFSSLLADYKKVWFGRTLKDGSKNSASVTLEKISGFTVWTVRYFTTTRAYIKQFLNADEALAYINKRNLLIVDF